MMGAETSKDIPVPRCGYCLDKGYLERIDFSIGSKRKPAVIKERCLNCRPKKRKS